MIKSISEWPVNTKMRLQKLRYNRRLGKNKECWEYTIIYTETVQYIELPAVSE